MVRRARTYQIYNAYIHNLSRTYAELIQNLPYIIYQNNLSMHFVWLKAKRSTKDQTRMIDKTEHFKYWASCCSQALKNLILSQSPVEDYTLLYNVVWFTLRKKIENTSENYTFHTQILPEIWSFCRCWFPLFRENYLSKFTVLDFDSLPSSWQITCCLFDSLGSKTRFHFPHSLHWICHFMDWKYEG